jgi:hypothetical protein
MAVLRARTGTSRFFDVLRPEVPEVQRQHVQTYFIDAPGRHTFATWSPCCDEVGHYLARGSTGKRTALIEAMACGTPVPRDAKVAIETGLAPSQIGSSEVLVAVEWIGSLVRWAASRCLKQLFTWRKTT